MNSEITVSIVLDKRRKKKESTFPVKLRVTFRRDYRYYSLKRKLNPNELNLTPEEFDKTLIKNPRKHFKDLQLKYKAIEKKAFDIIDIMPDFSFETFAKRFINKTSNSGSLINFFNEHIHFLKDNERFGDAGMYERTRDSIVKFYRSEKIRFEDITPSFLNKYELWMSGNNKSITTVGMYARCIRRIYRKAMNQGFIKEFHYPFGKEDENKYSIPQPMNIKKALNIKDIKKIIEYKPEPYSSEMYYRDIWIFSYLGNGMNIKDICLLKYKHIDNDMIIFSRAKTVRSNRMNKPIIVSLIDLNKKIMEIWGNKPKLSEEFIFPVLNENESAEVQAKKIKQFTKQINKYMKRIALKLEIKENITTYSARHSFATILKRSGVSLEYISESLGHSNIQTTENYLDSFEDETRKENTNKLIEF